MIIREEQLRALAEHQTGDYERRLTAFLQESFPDAAAESAAELQAVVACQIEVARSHGLEAEEDIATYVVTAWLLGLHFDSRVPPVREVLTAEIPGEMKAKFLEEWTLEMFDGLEGGD